MALVYIGIAIFCILALVGLGIVISWPTIQFWTLKQMLECPTRERFNHGLLRSHREYGKGLEQTPGLPIFGTTTDPLCCFATSLGFTKVFVWIAGESQLSQGKFVLSANFGKKNINLPVGETLHQWLLDYHEFDTRKLVEAAKTCQRVFS